MVTLTGQRLGEYDIGALRFRTPMFAAYTGRHRSSGLEVGVLHGTPRSGVDFASEVARLKAIRRPGLPLIIGWGNIGFTERALVTGPLGEALWSPGAPRLEWLNALSHLARICDCFEGAADAGLHHGGLTPECIRTDEDGDSVIVGLGASSLFALSPGAMVEQARFLAPEQLQRSPIADALTDIYALGMCLYSMLVGQLPFAAADPADLPALARHGAVEPLAYKEIPFHLNSLIRPMTAKDRQLRPQTYADVRLKATAVFARASNEHPEALKRALAEADLSQIKDPAVRRLGEHPEAWTAMFAPSADDEPESGPRLSGAAAAPDDQRAAPGERGAPIVDAPLVAALGARSPANDQHSITSSEDRPTPLPGLSDAEHRPSSGRIPRMWATAIGARRWLVPAALLALLSLCIVAGDIRNDTSSSSSAPRTPGPRALRSMATDPSRSRRATEETPLRRRLNDVRQDRTPVGERPEKPTALTEARTPAWNRNNVTAVFELNDD